MSNPALVIIDMQKALVAGAYDERGVLARIRSVADRMRTAGLPVIYVQHNHATYAPMMRGEPGWQIHDDIAPQAGDLTVEKTASDAFFETDLESVLRKAGADTVIVAGAQTEYCVDATCRAALSHGFDVTLLSDCHTTGDSTLTARQVVDHHNALLPNLAHPTKRITLVSSDEVRLPAPS